FFEGNPRERHFDGRDPVEYAREHRAALLGELAGMVDHWCEQGRPRSHQGHRCVTWAAIIGGILEATGFASFLGNFTEAETAFNSDLDEFAALAAVALEQAQEGFAAGIGGGNADSGRPPSEWGPLFQQAGMRLQALDGSETPRARATRIGL